MLRVQAGEGPDQISLGCSGGSELFAAFDTAAPMAGDEDTASQFGGTGVERSLAREMNEIEGLDRA